MSEDPKVRAAIAAVLQYLRSEEETVMQVATAPAQWPSPWAMSGRQSVMRMRDLLQRRLLKR